MTTSAHYKSNLRDIFFELFEVLDIARTSLGKGPFAAMDADTARAALEGLDEFVHGPWASCFVAGDREPLGFDGKGNVTLPPGFVAALDAYYDGGWNKLELPEHLGGYGAPPTVRWAAFELMAGGNASVTFYLLGNFLATIVDALGTDDQKARYLRNILDHHWGGTMVLTEPDAGSDVGAGLTRARHVSGDEYLIEGTKRFITNGDFDQPKNIVHLVLARPEGAGPGTKGLSMFLVPKYWVEADGSLGARNGAVVTKVEHKMGLKGSATCELTLGADAPCRGLLVGGKHDGIAQMFHVIEYARMGVGTKSMATLSTAYLNALEYAKERKQGADMKETSKSAPRVTIIHHPDVRRMLMLQKAFAEGLRGMVLWTASIQDQVALAGGRDTAEAKQADALNDLLLPLIKGYGSEKVYELLGSASLQTYGGSGYIQDYPIEQYVRDQKIDSLYEGTTHIQALDLFFRKVARDRGATLTRLLGMIKATCDELPEPLAVEKAALEKAHGDVGAIFMAMMGKVMQSPYHAGLQGNRILFSLAELVIGWRLVVGAKVALAKLGGPASDGDAFYRGKLAAARFYARTILPGIGLARSLVEASDLDLMDVPEEAFS